MRRMRRGQAMIEAVIAVLIVVSCFLCLFGLSRMLTAKMLVEHAAMRVARARTVGLNEFMCRKTARVSVIPAAGNRLWPEGEFEDAMELARVSIYMATPNGAVANGVLDYEGWQRLSVDAGDGTDTRTSLGVEMFEGSFKFRVDGKASIEENCTLYLNDQGL